MGDWERTANAYEAYFMIKMFNNRLRQRFHRHLNTLKTSKTEIGKGSGIQIIPQQRCWNITSHLEQEWEWVSDFTEFLPFYFRGYQMHNLTLSKIND